MLSDVVLPLTKEAYDFAMSDTCLLYFLIVFALAALTYFDAERRGVSGLFWAFVIVAVPYIGILFYLAYIILSGNTSLHLRKDPEAERIKKLWADTELSHEDGGSSSEDADVDGENRTASSPYRVK